MSTLLLAVITAVIGVVPLLVFRRLTMAGIVAAVAAVNLWWIYYIIMPSTVWPMYGFFGVCVLILWVICAAIDFFTKDAFSHAVWFPIVLLLLFFGRGCSGSAVIRANDYADLIGNIEERKWTQDIQPADPKHIRLVPLELAQYLANKQLGEATGAIGSQFQVSNEHMTLQMISGELWYVAPLDFKGFSVWQSTGISPGYVMVHGEDHLRPVIVKANEKFVYMPGAYFSDNLERHLWKNGYYDVGLTDYTFEIDDNGKPWWVVTVYEPTIAFFGYKVKGVVIIDPASGEIQFSALGQVPHWVDRVVPASFVENYIDYKGHYHLGWWNSVWTQKDITEAEWPNIIYGSDNEPYFAAGVTSSNLSDQSLVGLMYANSRTGKFIFYRVSGGTDEAVVQAVNNQVSYKKWHATWPVLYNLYGTMASVVPVLGENHTYQGVAIVRLDNLQVALGQDQYAALREYQNLFAMSGQQITPEIAHNRETALGLVDRFAQEVRGNNTSYYLHIQGVEHLFTGASELSPKLPLTKAGDKVLITYIASEEDVIPILAFDNKSLPLKTSVSQAAVRQKTTERKADITAHQESKSARGEIQNMSDEEVKELIKLRNQNKNN